MGSPTRRRVPRRLACIRYFIVTGWLLARWEPRITTRSEPIMSSSEQVGAGSHGEGAEDPHQVRADHVLERAGGGGDTEGVLEPRHARGVAQPRAQVEVIRPQEARGLLERGGGLVYQPARGGDKSPA